MLYDSIKYYGYLRDQIDRLSKMKKQVEATLEVLENGIIDVLTSTGTKSVKIAGFGSVGTMTKIKPVVGNAELLNEWLRDNGEGGVIKETVHYMSLMSLLTDRVGRELPLPPPEICEVKPVPSLVLRRTK